MEEKDVNSIAGAVSRELAKLNADTAKEIVDKNKGDIPPDVFKCPDCGGEVPAGQKFCMHCGCELEWGD